MKKHLIIFTRYPKPGKTKTRLIPFLGEKGAADLHRQMVENTLIIAKKLQQVELLSIEIRFTGGNLEVMQNWLGSDLIYDEQCLGDLGDRMKNAFKIGFNQGKKQIIIIGTDCPFLTVDILSQGFNALQKHSIVLGPAKDGGYYLIGLNRYIPDLFENIPWGTSKVLPKTIDCCETLHLSVSQLPELSDIDRPEDLHCLLDLNPKLYPNA